MVLSGLYFTENDHRRLANLLDLAIGSTDPRLRGDLRRLSLELRSANIVAPQDVPSDIVTLNSRVVVRDGETREEETWLLTLPEDASIVHNRLSVLSPLGTALLGARVGQIVTWETKERTGQVKVLKLLFQPEAAGCFEL